MLEKYFEQMPLLFGIVKTTIWSIHSWTLIKINIELKRNLSTETVAQEYFWYHNALSF